MPLPQRFSVFSPSIQCVPESFASPHPLPVSVVDCLLESPSHLPPVCIVCAWKCHMLDITCIALDLVHSACIRCCGHKGDIVLPCPCPHLRSPVSGEVVLYDVDSLVGVFGDSYTGVDMWTCSCRPVSTLVWACPCRRYWTGEWASAHSRRSCRRALQCMAEWNPVHWRAQPVLSWAQSGPLDAL